MPSNNPQGHNQHTNAGGNPGGGTQGVPSSGGRGFASMDPQRQREIAAQGGRAAHASGNAHEFTSQEARAAGSKSHGGQRAANAASGGNTRGGSQGHPDNR